MRKFTYSIMALLPLLLSACAPIGEKSASMSVVYMATALLSLLLLVGYFVLIRKKTLWFMFLFSSVFVVNTGYYLLSVSKTINTALFANRLSYLGSVFLPMAILMIILNVIRVNYKKWLPYLLSAINLLVFMVATSYPYLDIYYKDVTLKTINGVSVLNKVYGSWHILYLVFLLAYFVAMIAVIIYTSKNKKLNTKAQTTVLAIAVFVNIFVWLLEQLVNIDFEFLSVSYIISELFLMGLYLAIEDSSAPAEALEEKELPPPEEKAETPTESFEPTDAARLLHFTEKLPALTPTENKIYNCYLEGKTTKEIMASLNIKENTLKYHNKNLYGKLGVSSRKELLYFAKMLK